MRATHLNGFAFAVGVLLVAAPGLAGQKSAAKISLHSTRHAIEPPMQVRVTKTIRANNVTYAYRVINRSDSPVTGLRIGWDNCELHLRVSPDMELKIFSGATTDQFPSTSPHGWQFEVQTTEEDSLGCVGWEILGPEDVIAGGHELAGFSVQPPVPEAGYETAHWTVYVDSGGVACYSGTLTPDTVRTR